MGADESGGGWPDDEASGTVTVGYHGLAGGPGSVGEDVGDPVGAADGA